MPVLFSLVVLTPFALPRNVPRLRWKRDLTPNAVSHLTVAQGNQLEKWNNPCKSWLPPEVPRPADERVPAPLLCAQL